MTAAGNSGALQRKIALSMAKGMQGQTVLELIEKIGSIDNFFDFSSRQLAQVLGFDSPIFSDTHRQELLQRAQKEVLFIEQNRIKPLFIADADYPDRLRQCADAPAMLFTLGPCSAQCQHAVAIVGTRHASPYGIDFTQRLVTDLAKIVPGILIVSGLAYGIDITAHKAAIAAGLPTAAVLAHGLTTIYPADHRSIAVKMAKDQGLLITEYTQDYQMNRGSFLARNRIVAGLCDCTIVVESDMRGGSMSTARIASLYGREVLAVPGRVSDKYSRGTNHLIASDTARLITCAQDVAEAMGWGGKLPLASEPEAPKAALAPELQQIMDLITADPDLTVNDMCVRLGVPYATLSDRIFQLEMDDKIMQLPGGRYAPTGQ